jgi:hypothetical protein
MARQPEAALGSRGDRWSGASWPPRRSLPGRPAAPCCRCPPEAFQALCAWPGQRGLRVAWENFSACWPARQRPGAVQGHPRLLQHPHAQQARLSRSCGLNGLAPGKLWHPSGCRAPVALTALLRPAGQPPSDLHSVTGVSTRGAKQEAGVVVDGQQVAARRAPPATCAAAAAAAQLH